MFRRVSRLRIAALLFVASAFAVVIVAARFGAVSEAAFAPSAVDSRVPPSALDVPGGSERLPNVDVGEGVGCEVIVNPGFETGAFAPWVIDQTAPAPVVSNLQAHSGTFSGHVGSLPPGETPGDSSIYQTVTVPAGGGTLSYWYWPRTIDSITFDWQDAYVTNASGTVLATIMHVCSNAQTWTNVTFNMAPYAGQTVRIKFLAHGDNAGDPTDMFVDDVTLVGACAMPSPTPSTSPSPGCTPIPPVWTPMAPIPPGAPQLRYGFAQTATDFYLVGGLNSSFAITGALLRYNIAANTWTPLATAPTPIAQSPSVAIWNGKIYAIGGLNGTPTTTVQIYDIATNTWTAGAPIPNGTYGAAAGAFNNKVFVAGGTDPTGSAPTTTLFIYDIPTNSWSAGIPMPPPGFLAGGFTQS